MGTCQSQINREADIVVSTYSPRKSSANQKSTSPRKFHFELRKPSSTYAKNGVQPTSLISPAEGTEVTDVDSPFLSVFSPYTPDNINDERMDIDDSSSAAPSLSEQSGYSAPRDDPQNLLIPFDEEIEDDSYLYSDESNTPPPLRLGSITEFETHHHYPSSDRVNNSRRFQTQTATSPSHITGTVASPSPLLAPPKHVVVTFDSKSASSATSVNPQTLANFNRLKTQAELAKQLQQRKKMKNKIQDRRIDIQGYKNLWKEYSGIKDKASSSKQNQEETDLGLPDRVANRSISLNDSATWFVVRCIFRC
jgi:hypothetical protein